MIFLNPSILLGLLAASIPILIHILNFRKLKKVEFSTLAFLKELQKSKIKKIKIKQWLLLLLRTLIIVFLVLTFARPTLESTLFSGAASSAKTSIAFIIDNSFSMSLVDEGGSIFNKSKTEAKKIITQLENGDQFYFIIGSDSVRTTSNKKTAAKIIDNLKISYLPENITLMLKKANTILAESKNINKEIYLFSDFQKNTLTDSSKSRINTHVKQNNIKLYIFDMSSKHADNYSISNLKLNNAILELNKPISFSADIKNYSNKNTEEITASLFINEERVSQQNVALIPGEGKNIKFESSLKNTGLIKTKVVLEDDNIIQDNTAFLSFYVPRRIKTAIIYDDITNINFLNSAIISSSTSNRIEVSLLNSKRHPDYSLYDVIFFVSTNNSTLNSLGGYVSRGGQLVIIPPANISLTNLGNLRSKLNFPAVEKIIKLNSRLNDYSEFRFIDFHHPVFSKLFIDKIKKEIESPKIYKYIKTIPNSSVTPIIKLSDNTVFIGEYEFKKGKVVFFNVANNLEWSDFPLKAIYAPLISKIIYYLSFKNTTTKKYTIGNEIPINLKSILSPLIEVELPSGKESLNLEGIKNNVYNYKSTQIPGNYIFYADKKIVSFASVNTNKTESDLAQLKPTVKNEFFEKYYGNNFLNISPDVDFLSKIKQARYGTELWKPFLIIAFILALTEMFVARNTKKDLIDLN